MRNIKLLTICFCVFTASADANVSEENPSIISRIKTSISNMLNKKEKATETAITVKEANQPVETTEPKETAISEEASQDQAQPTEDTASVETSKNEPSENDAKKEESAIETAEEQIVTEEAAVEEKKDDNSSVPAQTAETNTEQQSATPEITEQLPSEK